MHGGASNCCAASGNGFAIEDNTAGGDFQIHQLDTFLATTHFGIYYRYRGGQRYRRSRRRRGLGGERFSSFDEFKQRVGK